MQCLLHTCRLEFLGYVKVGHTNTGKGLWFWMCYLSTSQAWLVAYFQMTLLCWEFINILFLKLPVLCLNSPPIQECNPPFLLDSPKTTGSLQIFIKSILQSLSANSNIWVIHRSASINYFFLSVVFSAFLQVLSLLIICQMLCVKEWQ